MLRVPVGPSSAILGGASGIRPMPHKLGTELAELVLTWFERARQRRQLSRLSAHMLKDIGLTRADVETELAKPFWRS
jgi:uncharacterized protein YjiS (DUF1127 family)